MDDQILAQPAAPGGQTTGEAVAPRDELTALVDELQAEEGLGSIEALSQAVALVDELTVYALLWDLTDRVTCHLVPTPHPEPEAPQFQPAKFAPGHVVATPAALEALGTAGTTAMHYLARHLRGDWGDVDGADRRANDHALLHGGRLLSAYMLAGNTKLWVITEADRAVTTLLLPSDY